MSLNVEVDLSLGEGNLIISCNEFTGTELTLQSADNKVTLAKIDTAEIERLIRVLQRTLSLVTDENDVKVDMDDDDDDFA